MSAESKAIFDQAYADYAETGDAEELTAAARGHVGASRPLGRILAEYAEAMEGQARHTREQAAAAQLLADELESVSTAQKIMDGNLPRAGA